MRRRLAAAVLFSAGALAALLGLSEGQDSLLLSGALADHCAVKPAASRPVLRNGSSGDQVAVLQVALLNAGYPSQDSNGNVYIDGLFGSPEEAAVKAFQTSRGISATGVADSATWSALDPFINKDGRVGASQPSSGIVSAAFNAAGFNSLFPGHRYFGLLALETGPAGSRTVTQPYIPPTLLKAIGWIESSWRQADSGGAPVISFDCGYGIMQITSPGVPLEGIPWWMKEPAPEPIYSGVQVPMASDYVANIAMGAKTLAAKFNLAPEYRPLVGDSNPAILEDWYYAVWSYNGFASTNDPNSFSSLRGRYSCNLTDGFSHNRSLFPYQELVYGCIEHPPLVEGVELWTTLPVTIPTSLPAFNPSNPGSMNIATPQPAHLDPTTGTFPPPVNIDGPSSGAAVAQPFVIGGWAVDYTAATGTGIDAVHVWAYPSDAQGNPNGQPPVFLGAAALQGDRPDVAIVYGNPSFAKSGFSLAVRGLKPGFYRLAVYARSTVTGAWYDSHRVVKAENNPAASVDTLSWGASARMPLRIAGWAIDRAAAAGTGVDAVHVWAYPSDANGDVSGVPVFLGAASYGGGRPDVAAVYGSQFTNSAYELWVPRLAPGFYRIVVYARSALSGAWQDSHRLVWVPSPAMGLDTPSWGATALQPMRIAGWAIDRAAATGTGVDTVHVWAYPANANGDPGGTPIFLGAAAYGGTRPDVAAVYGAQFANTAYELWASGLAPGFYRIIVYARSTVSGGWQDSHRLVWVPSPAMGLDTPGWGASSPQPFHIGGWAIDRAAASGAGVDTVHVWAYPSNADGDPGGTPIFLGAAAYGGARPDVAAVYGAQFANSAYDLWASGLAPGFYRVIIYARSAVSGAWNEAYTLVRVS